MKKRIRRLGMKACLLFVVLPLCIAVNVQAASFDCAKASTKVEHLICDNLEISRLDDELSASYKTALQDEKRAESIRQAQKEWLKERNSCADADCVKKAYGTRLQALTTSTGNITSGYKGTGVQQDVTPNKKPLYGHCVDLDDPHNCGSQSGKGYAVCETYLKYLNTLDKMPTCEVVVPPDFQRPNWEELDVMQHLDWAYQAEVFSHIGTDMDFKRKYPDEASWREKFLAEIQAGTIVPAMRTTRVTPIADGEEITLLAYTRNKRGCLYVAQQKLGSYWAGVGYAHFRIMDSPGSPLAKIEGAVDSMGFQTELLFYQGRPYFVEEFSPAGYDVPNIGIVAFSSRVYVWPGITEEEKYRVEERCQFNAINQKSLFE